MTGIPEGGTALSTVVAVAALACVLAFAVVRPRGWPEAVAAVPAAGLVMAVGALSPAAAGAETARLAPVIGFLAAVLVLAQLCEDEGVFRFAGALMARAGSPHRLLTMVFGLAAVTTAVLSLDATVVLLTPVVFATAARLGVRAKPHVYACTHLANSASLLLPVSNLTNLLAVTAAGISFTRFTVLMAAPWLVAIAVEYLVFRRFFATDLAATAPATPAPAPVGEVPVFALAVLAATLAGFVVTSWFGVEPVWTGLAGALVLAGHALARGRTRPRAVARAVNLPFLLFVIALGVVVRAVVDGGLADAVGHLVPTGSTLLALLAVAAIAAVLANLVNNLPAVLVLLPLVAPGGTGPVLAVLLGVNLGPNLTYVGSLATLLWRRIAHHHDTPPDLGEFTRLGLAAVPASLVGSVAALWAGLSVFGG